MTTSRRAIIMLTAWTAVTFGVLWGGAVPTALAQTVTVTSADPPAGEQGTINLNVLIKGKGFKNGAKAKFYMTGTTDPAGVNVKSTQYVSSTQLIANIDIDDAAALSLFDIEVALADGRTGKGTELFKVTLKGDTGELSALFEDATEDMFRSDGRGIYASAQDNGGRILFSRQDGFIDFQETQSINGRSATFEFTNNVRPAVNNGMVACREFGGDAFPHPEPAPAWLAYGLPGVTWFKVETGKLAVPPAENGAGVWTFSEGPFSVRDMTVGDTRIVVVFLSFKDDGGQQFSLRLNQEFWPPRGPLMDNPGFAKVTRESQDTWVLQPLGNGDPSMFGVLNQVNLRVYSPEVRKVHTGGYCDLGDWLMPFKITFTSVR